MEEEPMTETPWEFAARIWGCTTCGRFLLDLLEKETAKRDRQIRADQARRDAGIARVKKSVVRQTIYELPVPVHAMEKFGWDSACDDIAAEIERAAERPPAQEG